MWLVKDDILNGLIDFEYLMHQADFPCSPTQEICNFWYKWDHILLLNSHKLIGKSILYRLINGSSMIETGCVILQYHDI